MPNCSSCTTSNICTACANGTYLKSNSKACVSNCTIDDSGWLIVSII